MLTPFEQAACRAYGHGTVCLAAHDRKALNLIVPRMHSRSDYPVHGATYWMDTKKDGIHLKPHDGQPLVVTWRAVLAHVTALPASVRDYARQVDRDAHKPPASTLEWNNPYRPEPRTEAQRLAHLLWHDSVRTREADVLEQAFPDTEPEAPALDLFTSTGTPA